MIRAGIEKPVSGSDFVHSYAPKSDQMILGESFGETTARYSFSCDTVNELEQLTLELVRSITEFLQVPGVVLTGWRVDSAMLNPTRARLLEYRHRKEGFRIESNGQYRIAISNPFFDLDSFKMKQLITGTSFVLWGVLGDSANTSSIDRLKRLVLSCARSFAAPDREAAEILDHEARAICYVLRSDSIRPGLVILSNRDGVTSHLDQFIRSLKVEIGDAHYVWQQ